jgi:hypothetical protein
MKTLSISRIQPSLCVSITVLRWSLFGGYHGGIAKKIARNIARKIARKMPAKQLRENIENWERF